MQTKEQKLNKGNFSPSKWLLVVIAIFWFSLIWTSKPWQKNLLINDIENYYGYLPATFIYHDLGLKFTSDPFFNDKYAPKITANGGKVIKMSMGLSFLYTPFFLVGHVSAGMLHQPQDGFSQPYQVSLVFSCLFYLLLGLFYLRKLLLFYFSEGITTLTIFTVFFGTNLLWYSTFDGLMSHGYLFSWLVFFIYQIVCWHRDEKLKRLIYIGLVGGLITLIRPTMILCFLFFILYDVYNKQTLLKKISLFKRNIKGLIALFLGFLLAILPQLIYWKYNTGSWFFFSYVGERFYFNHPHVFLGLLGFRKGWLIYTPVMIFALLGFVYLWKLRREYTFAIIIPFIISIYVIFSWWCWWYGGSFGQRPMVDFYGMLAVPMAVFYKQVFGQKRIILKVVTITVVTLLISLNLFQTKQFSDGLIHYDAMTKASYAEGFFATGKNPSVAWYEALDEPDYDRICLGFPETIAKEEIDTISPDRTISLKGYNLRYVSCEIGGSNELSSSRITKQEWESFRLIHLEGNKISLKADNGKYISADHGAADKLIANRESVGAWETFELLYLGNNQVALKADNNKYVTTLQDYPNSLVVQSDSLSKKEKFRIYINIKK
jgi:hypothetical protein